MESSRDESKVEKKDDFAAFLALDVDTQKKMLSPVLSLFFGTELKPTSDDKLSLQTVNEMKNISVATRGTKFRFRHDGPNAAFPLKYKIVDLQNLDKESKFLSYDEEPVRNAKEIIHNSEYDVPYISIKINIDNLGKLLNVLDQWTNNEDKHLNKTISADGESRLKSDLNKRLNELKAPQAALRPKT